MMTRYAVALLMAALAAPLGAEDLAAIFALSKQNDPQVRAAEARWRAAAELNKNAISRLLPTINANASQSESGNESTSTDPNARFQGGSHRQSGSSSTSWDLSLVQPLFNMQALHGKAQVNALSRQARARFDDDYQRLILRTAEAYFETLRRRDTLDSLQVEREALQKQMEQAREMYDSGSLEATSYYEAQARYDEVSASALDARSQLFLAFEDLANLTGADVQRLQLLSPSFPTAEPADVDGWVARAKDSSNDLKIAAETTAAARHNWRVQRSAALPTLTLNARYSDGSSDGFRDSLSTSGQVTEHNEFESTNTGNSVSIDLSMPLFTGGRIASDSRRARHQWREAQENQRVTELDLVRQVRSLYYQVLTNARQISARTRALQSSSRAFESTESSFSSGTRNLLELLTAQRNLFQARRDLANARYDYILNSMRLKRSSGLLADDDLLTLNQWLAGQDFGLGDYLQEDGG